MASRTTWSRALPWAAVGALAIGLALVLTLWAPWQTASPPQSLRLSAELGADVSLAVGLGDATSRSPDGSVIAFVAQKAEGKVAVSSAGGTPEPLTSLAEGEVIQRWPQVLPGGQAVLFTATGPSGSYNDANLVVQTLPTGARTVVQRGGYHGRYLSSGPGSPRRGQREGGHLLYLHDGALFAAPFDVERLAVTGPPVRALAGVTTNSSSGGAQFAVSASGTLVYLPGPSRLLKNAA